MLAIREIKKVDAETITIKIPKNFREKEVEIIILPYTDRSSEDRPTGKLKQFDQLVKNAKKRNIKIDKTINIDALMNEMNNGLC